MEDEDEDGKANVITEVAMAVSLSFSLAAARAAFSSAFFSRIISLRPCRLTEAGFGSFFTASRAAPVAAVDLDSPSSMNGWGGEVGWGRLGREWAAERGFGRGFCG